MPEPKVVNLQEMTEADLAAANPELVKRIQANAIRKAEESRDALRAVVKATELPADIQARLMERVDGLSVDEAKRVCARAEAVEGSLASGKMAGLLTDEDIATLREDVADLPQASACAIVERFVKAKRPAAKAAGNVADTAAAETQASKDAKAEEARLAPVKAEIEKGRDEWKLVEGNFASITEKDFVETHLATKGVKASDEDLAKACPDLFKVKGV